MTAFEHPEIAAVMCTGYLKTERYPVCPICGSETDTFIKNREGYILGCDNCTMSCDAWEEVLEWES